MINLLPTQLKDQTGFAKRNQILIKYVWLAGIVLLIVSASFTGADIYLNHRIDQATTDLSQKETQINSYKGLEEQAKQLNDRVAAIKEIQAGQPKFSLLLTDLAKAMPKGASLTALTLTGDDKKPVRINASADTYNTVVALRDALAASSRIAGVDLDSINSTTSGVTADLTISFKPGQAR